MPLAAAIGSFNSEPSATAFVDSTHRLAEGSELTNAASGRNQIKPRMEHGLDTD